MARVMRVAFRAGLAVCVLTAALAARDASAQTGRVGGTVKDEHGKPIKGATVIAQNPEGTPNSISAATDEKGRFSMIGFRPGTWTFRAWARGFEPQIGQARIRTLSANPPLEFRLPSSPAPPPMPLTGVDPAQLETQLIAADRLMAAQKWDEAIAAYQAILTKVPPLTMVNLQLAHAWRMKGDTAKAAQALNTVRTVDPDNQAAMLEGGLTALAAGDLGAAESSLAPLAKSHDFGDEACVGLGEVAEKRQQPDEAATWYRRAVEVAPTSIVPRLRLGQLALARGDAGTATSVLRTGHQPRSGLGGGRGGAPQAAQPAVASVPCRQASGKLSGSPFQRLSRRSAGLNGPACAASRPRLSNGRCSGRPDTRRGRAATRGWRHRIVRFSPR